MTDRRCLLLITANMESFINLENSEVPGLRSLITVSPSSFASKTDSP